MILQQILSRETETWSVTYQPMDEGLNFDFL